MTRNEYSAAGLIVTLLFIGALSYLPAGLEPPLTPPPVPVTPADPSDTQPWPQWLEGRLRPVMEATPDVARVEALDGYTLVGLVEVDGRRLAMIAGGGATRSLALGDLLDGYEAIEIEADRLVLTREGDEVVLRLRR